MIAALSRAFQRPNLRQIRPASSSIGPNAGTRQRIVLDKKHRDSLIPQLSCYRAAPSASEAKVAHLHAFKERVAFPKRKRRLAR